MNKSHAPTLGANSLRPRSLPSIKPSLQALADAAATNGGSLTPSQAQTYLKLYESWQFYRPAQPARFQGELDGLCDAIGNLPVVVRAAA